MALFTHNDTVRVKQQAPLQSRPGELASVVGISTENDRRGDYLARFPDGVVYTIEFEDGSSDEIHESLLEKGRFPGERLQSSA